MSEDLDIGWLEEAHRLSEKLRKHEKLVERVDRKRPVTGSDAFLMVAAGLRQRNWRRYQSLERLLVLRIDSRKLSRG